MLRKLPRGVALSGKCGCECVYLGMGWWPNGLGVLEPMAALEWRVGPCRSSGRGVACDATGIVYIRPQNRRRKRTYVTPHLLWDIDPLAITLHESFDVDPPMHWTVHGLIEEW